jgi:branched-chain amino acid transport system permease protein
MVSSRSAVPIAIAVVVGVFLVTVPMWATGYWMTAIFAQSLILGIVALSLIFLAGYGNMVSLAQTAVYGLAGYTIGIMTVNHSYLWWVAAIVALIVASVAAAIFGVISVRSQGIYFLMITLALGQVVYSFAEENYTIFNGHGGINGEKAPTVGGLSFNPIFHPKPFYYLCLIVATVMYLGLRYVVRSPFGLALQGVRDNPRRMRALGYWVEGTRVAAFTLAGLVAGVGGVLAVWYYSTMSPGSIDLTRTLDILIMAVIGGLIYFEGAFVGAFIWVEINTFASSVPTIHLFGNTFSPTERYNTIIGLVFLLIVLFSPNGAIGLAEHLRRLVARGAGLVAHPASPLRQEDLRPSGGAPAPAGRVSSSGSPEGVQAEEVDRGIKA